jgi:hypothetical protein
MPHKRIRTSKLVSAEVFWCHIIPGDPYDLFPVPGAGFGKGQAAVELAPLETGCELRYAVKSTIGGKLAQIGQRLIDAAAKSLAEDFFKRFEAVLRERTGQAGG